MIGLIVRHAPGTFAIYGTFGTFGIFCIAYQPTAFPLFCSSSQALSGAK